MYFCKNNKQTLYNKDVMAETGSVPEYKKIKAVFKLYDCEYDNGAWGGGIKKT